MEVVFTEGSEQPYKRLTKLERQRVQKALALLESDPRHPGLRVKKMERTKGIWEARASRNLRMTFAMEAETMIMRNVGEHNRVLKNP